MKLSERSYEKELLDAEEIPLADLELNLRELQVINSRLGGDSATLAGYRYFTLHHPEPLSIVEIGCGGGDSLKLLADESRKEGRGDQFTGVDIKPDCIGYAIENCKDYPEISFVVSDYRDMQFTKKPDLFFSVLFCHHLNKAEFAAFLEWQQRHSRLGFFMNDLHRHALAYYSIKYLTRWLSKSHLVKHDAPLSVKRGFKREDLEGALLRPFHLQWVWAFRWLLIKENGR